MKSPTIGAVELSPQARQATDQFPPVERRVSGHTEGGERKGGTRELTTDAL